MPCHFLAWHETQRIEETWRSMRADRPADPRADYTHVTTRIMAIDSLRHWWVLEKTDVGTCFGST